MIFDVFKEFTVRVANRRSEFTVCLPKSVRYPFSFGARKARVNSPGRYDVNPEPIQEPAAPVPPTTAGMTTKVVKGSLWTLAGQVAPLGVSLFTTPFVIRLLGSEGYGVLILVGLIPTYFAFADLGMGIASTKFASEAYAAGDGKREASTVHTAAAMSFILSVPVAALIFIFSNTAVGLFNVPEHLRGEANLALKIASVTFVLNFLNSIFNTPQLTRLRMDLNTFVSSGFRMLGLIATPITIYLGGGIAGAVTVLLAVSILTLAANIAVSGKLLRELFTFTLNRNAIRPMLKFGRAMALAAIASAIIINVEKIALPSLTSVKELAYYSVAFTLAFMMTLFSVAMAQSLIPAFSQLQGESKRSELSALYSRAIRMNLIWLAPVLVVLGIFGEFLITIWAGKEFGVNSGLPFNILLVGVGFHVVSTPARAAMLASGRSDVIAKVGWAEITPYIIFVVFLTNRYGGAGAAAAWSIRAIFDAMLSFYLVYRISRVTYMIRGKIAYLVGVGIVLVPLMISAFFETSYFLVALFLVIAISLYGIIIRQRFLYPEEVTYIKAYLRKFAIFNKIISDAR